MEDVGKQIGQTNIALSERDRVKVLVMAATCIDHFISSKPHRMVMMRRSMRMMMRILVWVQMWKRNLLRVGYGMDCHWMGLRMHVGHDSRIADPILALKLVLLLLKRHCLLCCFLFCLFLTSPLLSELFEFCSL